MDIEALPRRRPIRSTLVSGFVPCAVGTVLTALVAGVIVVMLTVLGMVLVLQPHSPYVEVQSARLDTLRYDQPTGTLTELRLALLLEARNPNGHSSTTFSDVDCGVAFGDVPLVELRAGQFAVAAGGALPLPFVASVQGAALGDTASEAMESGMGHDVVALHFTGQARTRWRFSFVTIHQWTRLDCRIQLSVSNGTAFPFVCTSRNNHKFF